MFVLEMKKNIKNLSFLISVLLLYSIFMTGDSGHVLGTEVTANVIIAIWNKVHGSWTTCSDSSYLIRMHGMWTDNAYLPVLMPFVCGLPGVMNYLDEVSTGNKRLILIRCSFRKYYASKMIANLLSSVLVSGFAVFFYYLTLLFFYDKIPVSDEAFSIVYLVFSGEWVEMSRDIHMSVVYCHLLKELLCFFLYSGIVGSFCFWMAVWFKDKYTVFGGTIFLSYLQWRIVEELVRRFINEGTEWMGTVADVLNPIFLHYAGESGFYMDKGWLAVLIALLLILLNCGIAALFLKKRFDISE